MNHARRTRVVISFGGTVVTLAAATIPLALITVACAARSPEERAGTAGSVDVPPDASLSEYVDGSYAATGWYGSLPSSITVTLSLFDDVITAVEVEPHATEPTSLDFQRRFAAAVPEVVVGRRIADVKLDRIAGSSGTPQGFNDALRQIREQARRSPAPQVPYQ
jgi:uncharacterized protein with FMN-binding domain